MMRMLVLLSPCVYLTPPRLLNWVPTLIRVSIRPFVCVVATRVLMTGELLSAWQRARPTVSIPGLCVVRLRNSRIEAENELHGRRMRMLCLPTTVSILGGDEALILESLWSACGMNVCRCRLLWLMLHRVYRLARLRGLGRWKILRLSMLSLLIKSLSMRGLTESLILRCIGGLK